MSSYFCLRETADITAFIASDAALPAELVRVSAALGRVLAHDTCAPLPCPADNRSTRDGYALRAEDIAGASPQNPATLLLAGECPMGSECTCRLRAGEAWRVYTGGPLPHGADVVVMQEDTVPGPAASSPTASGTTASAQVAYGPAHTAHTPAASPLQTPAGQDVITVCRSYAAGTHVLARGADMPEGALLAKAGTKLGAHHIALLAQFYEQVPVHRQAVLGVLATGDEFCTSGPATCFAQGPTSTNALLLEALATTLGIRCLHLGTVPDNICALKGHLLAALPDGPTPCDVIVVIGGSSGGRRDFSAQAIAGLPGCHIYGHDQRVSSGRPLTLARVGQTSIWGLPGHALSLALAAQVFLVPLLQRLGGQQTTKQTVGSQTASSQIVPSQPTVLARLAVALPVEGIAPAHYPVMLRPNRACLTAWPVLAGTGKTAVLRDMHGWITMPGSQTQHRGLRRGAALRVRLFV